MPIDERGLSIEDLAGAVGTRVRTIRYYIAEGLLPGPDGRGKTASYGEDHLSRLRLIRQLSDRRLPLTEIRERLSRLSANEVRSLLAEESAHSAELDRAARSPSPREYISALLRQAQAPRIAPEASRVPAVPPVAPTSSPTSRPVARRGSTSSGLATWQRWELAPGVELHLRADAQTQYHQLIARLLRAAEDPDDQSVNVPNRNP
jgi:DNA-binding transcriptional MerR regulator